jgi:drug/metabolite transporter (DMT)-like permease
MYWLIRRSAATGFASLFYLVPVVTALFASVSGSTPISILGMLICASGVALVNRDIARPTLLRSRIASRQLYWANSQGRKTRRPTGSAGQQKSSSTSI